MFKKFRPLEINDCPFVNLPETKSGRWGAGLTAAKMKECRWLKPVLVQAAWNAVRTKRSYLRAKYLRLKSRRGAKKAIVAAGSLDLLKFMPTLRPDLECRRLWNCKAIHCHQVREELALTALRVWLEIVSGLG